MFNVDSSQHFSGSEQIGFSEGNASQQISLETHTKTSTAHYETARKTPGVMRGMCVTDSLLTLLRVT